MIRPNIEGWLGVICWGIAFRVGWEVTGLLAQLVAWVAQRIAN